MILFSRKNLQTALIVILLISCCRDHPFPSSLQLHDSRDTILDDGKQQSIIFANVRDSSGNPITGATVNFSTSAGTLSETRVTTVNGIARTRLTSSTSPGVATVTAAAVGAGADGSTDVIQIVFTDDPQATVAGNDFIVMTGKYLVYSVTDHIIEAEDSSNKATLEFRNFTVTADRIQLICNNRAQIIAQGDVIMHRGKYVVKAATLTYSMETGSGYAVVSQKGVYTQVQIGGVDLKQSPVHGYVPVSMLTMRQIQTKLVVVAKSITYFPGNKFQFVDPRFYQDNLMLLKLPYYEMKLGADQLFSDQFVSVGTSGLGLEIPYYYELSPRTAGIFTIEHQQQIGRGYYSQDPGWSFDLMEKYSGGGANAYQGNYGFTGLTRGDWGFHFSHSQAIGDNSQGSIYLDFPSHSSFFSDISLSTQQKLADIGFDFNAGQSLTGISGATLQSNAYIDTVPHAFSPIHGVLYTLGTNLNYGYSTSSDPLIRATDASQAAISARFFTHPVAIDRLTSFNQSLSFGRIWTATQYGGYDAELSLSLDHTMSNGGAFTLAYDYLSTPTSGLDGGGKHRVSINYTIPRDGRFQASLMGTSYLDANSAVFLADLAYRLNARWRLLFSSTLESFTQESYKDFEFTIGRRIGAREIQLTYSTFSKRIYFDLTTTTW